MWIKTDVLECRGVNGEVELQLLNRYVLDNQQLGGQDNYLTVVWKQ